MKKTIVTDRIANELRGASLFFQRPTPAPEPPANAAGAAQVGGRSVPVPPRVDHAPDQAMPPPEPAARPSPPGGSARTARTPVWPSRRFMIRHAFEVYQDQLETLRRLAAQERLRGGQGSMSRIVREALDRAIAEHRRRLTTRRAEAEPGAE